MKTQKTEWQSLLDYANEELKKKGYSLRITETEEGFFRCEILHNGVLKDCYGENYFEGELEDLISDAWHSILISKEEDKPKVYVGRWNMASSRALREEGVGWLYEATKEEVIEELAEETEKWNKTHEREDKRIGVYTLEEFEAEFNEDLDGSFNTKTYWIKFF